MGVNNPHYFWGLIWWVNFGGRSKRYTKTVGGWFHDAWNDNSNVYLLSHGFLLNMICNWDNLTRGRRRSCWPLTNNGHFPMYSLFICPWKSISHIFPPKNPPKKFSQHLPTTSQVALEMPIPGGEGRPRSPDKAAESSEPLSSSAWRVTELWEKKKPTATRGTMDGKWQY